VNMIRETFPGIPRNVPGIPRNMSSRKESMKILCKQHMNILKREASSINMYGASLISDFLTFLSNNFFKKSNQAQTETSRY